MAILVEDKKGIVLKTTQTQKLASVFGEANIPFKVKDDYFATKHNVLTHKILAGMGFNLEGKEPMRVYYKYPKLHGMFDPMEHQKDTAVFVSQNPKAFVLNTQRTGKTASCLWASDYLYKEGIIDKVLICCTVSNCATWLDEIKAIFASRAGVIVRGEAKVRRELLQKDVDYHIINHDGIKVVADIWDNYITPKTLLIIDEARLFSDSQSDRWKVLNCIANKCSYVWGLTGTPLSGGPDAVFGFIKLIAPNRVPKSFYTWREMTMFKVSATRWVPKNNWRDIVHNALQPAIRFNADDVLDLPPVQMMYRPAELTADQKKAYNLIKEQGAIALKEGRVVAQNAGVEVFKLLQIASGVVKIDSYDKEDEGKVLHLPPKPRLKVLDEIIEGSEAKVIVFASFHAIVDMLTDHCSKYGAVWVDGRVTGRKRDEAIQRFQGDDNVKVLVAHPRTTSHGLEFAMADTIVWFSPNHSLELYDQANKRIQSALQKRNMGIYHIYCTQLEKAIYDSLARKSLSQSSFLELYKKEILG